MDGARCCGAAAKFNPIYVCEENACCIHLFTVMEYVWKQYARKINLNNIYNQIASLVYFLLGRVSVHAYRLADLRYGVLRKFVI